MIFEPLVGYYQNAKCFLFPSLYELSGLLPVEAMECGCPVVVSDLPALKERCGDAAIYCDPSNTDSIAAAVEEIMDDKTLRSHSGHAARNMQQVTLGKAAPFKHWNWFDGAFDRSNGLISFRVRAAPNSLRKRSRMARRR